MIKLFETSLISRWSKFVRGLMVLGFVVMSLLLLPAQVMAATSSSGGLVVVAGKINIKPGTKPEFTKIAMKCLVSSRQEPGSVSYSFYEDQTSPNTILYFEEWRDQAALDHHFQTPYFKEFMADATPLFDGTPEIKVYHVADAATL